MLTRRSLTGLVAAGLLIPGGLFMAAPAVASSLTITCGVGAPTTQTITINVNETLNIGYGYGTGTSCTGITTVTPTVGSFYKNGSAVTTGSALAQSPTSDDVLTYVSAQAGAASIELDSATLNITVTAGNTSPDLAATPADLPPVPVATAPTAVAGVVSATVIWKPGTGSGQLPTIRYEVRASDKTHGCVVFNTDPSKVSSSCTVFGLKAGTSYTFTVQPQNEKGWGEVSAPSNAVVPDYLSAPKSVSVSDWDSEWKPNDIVDYRISWVDAPDQGDQRLSHVVEIAECAVPCTPQSATNWHKLYQGTLAEGLGYTTTGVEVAPIAVRVKALVDDNQSDWTYGISQPVGNNDDRYFDPVGLQAWCEGLKINVAWDGGHLNKKYNALYEIQRRSKATSSGQVGSWQPVTNIVGSNAVLSLPKRLDGQYVQYRIRATWPGADPMQRLLRDSNFVEFPWREVTDALPRPDVKIARIAEWGSGHWTTLITLTRPTSPGASNISEYEVQADIPGKGWVAAKFGRVTAETGDTSFAARGGGRTGSHAPQSIRVRSVVAPDGSKSAWETIALTRVRLDQTMYGGSLLGLSFD